jgi:NitT/TauT family transport system substrate-binding protein
MARLGSGLQSWALPVPLAEALGYYKDEGLDVTMETLSSTSKGAQALVGGSVDVGAITYQETIRMAAEGQRLRSFYVISKRGTNVLVVAPSATEKIKRIEDLKGQTIGVASPGSANDLFTRKLLADRGIQQADFSTVAIGMSGTAIAAIESGRLVAGALSGGAHLELQRRHPGLRILVDGSTPEGMMQTYGSENYASGVLMATQTWIDGHAEASRKLARATLRAQRWMAAHTPEEILAKLPEDMRSKDQHADLDILRWSAGWYTADGKMPAGAPEVVRRYMAATSDKIRDAKIDLAATWTDQYLEAAK